MMENVIPYKIQEIDDKTDYSKLKECTIVIPTYNRPEYLRRILRYYERTGIPSLVIVADSSPDEIKDLNRDICEACHNLEVQYRSSYNSNLNFYCKIIDAVQQVSTPFVVLCADDDYIIPRGILASIEFLSAHPEYNVAQGRLMRFYFFDGVREINYFDVPNRNINIDDASVEKRLLHFKENFYPTWYAVQKSAFLQQMFIFAKDSGLILEYGSDPVNLSEKYLTWMTAIYSRIGRISCLYSFRDGDSVRQFDIKKGWVKDFSKVKDSDHSGIQFEEKSNPYIGLKAPIMTHLKRQAGMEECDAGRLLDLLIEGEYQCTLKNRIKERSMKWRIMKFMSSVLPHNRFGDGVRRYYGTHYLDHYSLHGLLTRQLIDDRDYQDCCLIQESILEFEDYLKR
jgi:glycosyltransferase domain-containing protein